jgi:hypothetical protein
MGHLVRIDTILSASQRQAESDYRDSGAHPEMLMVRWSIMCGLFATMRVYLQSSSNRGIDRVIVGRGAY